MVLSTRKRDANRRNAQLAKGPNDTSLTRLNALKHGILSEQVLIRSGEGKEDPEEFQQFCDAMRKDLAPEGAIEEFVAEDLISIAWRMRRVVAHESAVISEQSTVAVGDWDQQYSIARGLKQNLPEGLDQSTSRELTSTMAYATLMTAGTRRTVLAILKEDCPVSDPAVQITVGALARELGVPVDDILGPEPEWEMGESYTPEAIQQVIDAACESNDISRSQFWRKVWADALRMIRGLDSERRQLASEGGGEIKLTRLPDDPKLTAILRYDTHFSRRFYRVLHEFRRLQAA